MTNSAEPDHLASSETNRSGSTLFAKTGHVMKRRLILEIKAKMKQSSILLLKQALSKNMRRVKMYQCSVSEILFLF